MSAAHCAARTHAAARFVQALGKHYKTEELIQQLGSTKPMANIWKSGIERSACGCVGLKLCGHASRSHSRPACTGALTRQHGVSWAATKSPPSDDCERLQCFCAPLRKTVRCSTSYSTTSTTARLTVRTFERARHSLALPKALPAQFTDCSGRTAATSSASLTVMPTTLRC